VQIIVEIENSSVNEVTWIDNVSTFNRGDINFDGIVNFKDFTILADQWLLLPGNPSADIAPGQGDSIINELDLKLLVENWLR